MGSLAGLFFSTPVMAVLGYLAAVVCIAIIRAIGGYARDCWREYRGGRQR